MGLYSLNGTISKFGQCEFDNDLVIYAFVEIVDAEGARTLVKKVAVCVDIQAAVGEGTTGEFFFDAVFVFGRRYLCQFWGIKTAERSVTDGANFRAILAPTNLILGIFLTPLFGYGLPRLIAGIGQSWSLLDGSGDRKSFFHERRVLTAAAAPADARQPLAWPERLGLDHRKTLTALLRKHSSRGVWRH